MSKPRIFLSVGTYLPGYRGGGPTQSIKNLVEALANKFDFYIFTANHDLGISKPYNNIETDRWNKYDGVNIFYSSDQNKSKNLEEILKQNSFSLIFLNSFFSTTTIRILFLRKQLNLQTPVILMPRGELSEGALSIRKTKKKLYIYSARIIGILNNIHYLTTAEDEYKQVHKLLATDNVNKVSNIPNTINKITLDTKEENKLKVVFLSRITQKKNLDYALEILSKCKGNIIFDIYGTTEEKSYWKKCEAFIKNLPDNITVNYQGELANEKVIPILSKYDLFFFPTKSENYGHVISEALQASIPVLISDQTPWKKLAEDNLGWEYQLSCHSCFINKIEELVSTNRVTYNSLKQNIKKHLNSQSKVKELSRQYEEILLEKSTL